MLYGDLLKEDKTGKELNKEMLDYYKYQNIQNRLTQETLREQTETEEKRKRELLAMSKKVNKLSDKKLVDTLYSIIIEKWESEDEMSTNPEGVDPFNILEIQEWFLNKGIDIKLIGLSGISYSYGPMGSTDSEEPRSYFDIYGLKERIRWSKILLNLRKKLKEYVDAKERETFADIVDKLVKRAREDNLFSVSTAHIKQYSSELGIDTSRQVNLLTNAVSTRLQKDFGGQEPKRNRTLTNSIKIEVFKRDNYTCQECGAGREAKLHVHHIIPFSRGGSDEMSNLITLCESCNEAIGNRVYLMKPKTSQKTPS
jgi:5-methylcytosine-specific restriction endonuclease McrA